MAKAERATATSTTVNSSVRKYLTPREVERLMNAARKSGRYGHRDATMILIAFRHGLRASELTGLRWSTSSSPPAACTCAGSRMARLVSIRCRVMSYALCAVCNASSSRPRMCSRPSAVVR